MNTKCTLPPIHAGERVPDLRIEVATEKTLFLDRFLRGICIRAERPAHTR